MNRFLENPFDALLEIAQQMNTMPKSDVLLERIMDIAMQALGAERGFILLRSQDNPDAFEAVTARNISQQSITSIQELSKSVVNQVLDSGEPIVTLDARADARFSGAESIVLQNIQSVICTPMILNNQTIGAIYMDSRAGKQRFDENSLQFLQAFAHQATIVLEQVRLVEKLQAENTRLKKQIRIDTLFPEIIGRSTKMLHILQMVRDVAPSDATVLIEGESGTGKELVARAIHRYSNRVEKPFIPIFCGSLAENLLESELFGHKKGAFTGAVENKKGLFEEAHGGTIFLDEISEIPPAMQTKLLRVLQEGEVKRIGETSIRKVDVRVVAATNKELWKEVEAGRFREDLYYRLNVIKLTLPPLRERRDDIPLLAEHFLKKYASRNRKHITGFTKKALDYLLNYHWPGNVRELENAIERAVILSRSPVIDDDLFQLDHPRPAIVIGKTLKEIEKDVVLQTLEMTGYNRTKTAEILGVSRRWLQYQLKSWGMIHND